MPGTTGGPAPNARHTLAVTERNPAEVAGALRDWLGERLGGDAMAPSLPVFPAHDLPASSR